MQYLSNCNEVSIEVFNVDCAEIQEPIEKGYNLPGVRLIAPNPCSRERETGASGHAEKLWGAPSQISSTPKFKKETPRLYLYALPNFTNEIL